jgi:sarcosine oxidase subunit alpha
MQRLAHGGRIDRTRPLAFTFDGRSLTGYAGDTLASALLANDVALVGRSFKYHRPRGVLTAGAEEPNALVRVGEGAFAEPNLRATRVELHDGLVAVPQNCWPGLAFDARAVTDLLHALVPAGFYYKTFLWPRWSVYEGAIRRTAGLGIAPSAHDPSAYTTQFAHCDALVVGGGPTGLAAAEAAAAQGGRVMLVDDEPELGGSLLWRAAADDPALAALPARIAALRARPNVRVLTRTSAAGCYDHGLVVLHERLVDHLGAAAPADAPRHRLWQVRAQQVLIAAGAIERPLAFPDNDRPGIMLADAVIQYLRRYAVRAGDRAALFANNDAAYATAFALADAGAEIVAVIDVRPAVSAVLRDALRVRHVALHEGSAVIGTQGRRRLRRIRIASLEGKGTRTIDCDLLAMSGGYAPCVHLYSQAGGTLRFDDARSCFRPAGPLAALRCIGAADGEGIDDVSPFWRVPASVARGRQWIDFQNDVTVDDIALAARENFVSVEHMKRYTTTGMATDQGKTSNVNALAILAAETQRAIPAVGTTTFRPPYVPVTLGAIAGRHVRELYRPRRFLPAHRVHADAGAVFAEYGGWQRPEAYPRGGESVDAATVREIAAVREGVGLFDGSPLGKIEIAGPDAERLLDHLFVTRIEGLGVGRLRYGVMASEHGVVLDDGVVTRFAADRFWLGASSAHAAHIAQAIDEWLQCEWTSWQATVTDATRQWAGIALAGPRARDVLAAAGTDIDLANAAFPHMSVREGRVAGLPARVARVSFSGELQYEVNVAAGHAVALWERLRTAGADAAITPIGMEAWLALRLEKGYPVVGIDTDGNTLPEDLAPSAWRKKAANFVGRRSLMRPHALRDGREQLVGLEGVDAGVRLPVGAHVLPSHDATPPCASAGRITSSMVSVAIGKSVALALLANGRARIGESLVAYSDGRRYAARVVPLPFYDPQGARLNG